MSNGATKMINFNCNPLCKQAELYYYDYLNRESGEPIPYFVIEHIEQCQNCRQQINRLRETLSLAD